MLNTRYHTLIFIALATLGATFVFTNQAVFANIHKCVTEYGFEYSDRHCTHGILVRHSHTGSRNKTNILDGLSVFEIKMLAAMEQQYEHARKQTKQRELTSRARGRRERKRQIHNQARACAKAARELNQIRTLKRKGYTLKKARTLDEKEERLKRQQRDFC
ncbi:MAG: hypothetical protein KUG75_11450 [Pseudomonadales bacterium]|nr:hypothetical protein [Pseudomonadales bacterium]